jgi:hypothetical protein
MEIEKFELNINKKDSIDFITKILFCCVGISISIYFIYLFNSIRNLKFSYDVFFVFLLLLSFLVLCIYGLFELFNPPKILYLKNKLTKEKNLNLTEIICKNFNGKDLKIIENIVDFTIQRKVWSNKFNVQIFTENEIIAIYTKVINSNNKKGIDFGSTKKLNRKIYEMFVKACH